MTAFEKIKSALDPLGIPVTPDFFGGGAAEWITYNEAGDFGRDDGDDAPGCNLVGVQIHYFLPMSRDYLENKRAIRHALRAAGFTYPSVTVITDKELDTRHIIYECEITEEV